MVVGHWLALMAFWRSGAFDDSLVVDRTRRLWAITWLVQVVPLFFFVGGFANFVSFTAGERRGESAGRFLRRRLARLLIPTFVFLGFWTVVVVALHVLGLGGGGLLRGVSIAPTAPFGPLWFLGVYLVVILLVPATVGVHRRFGAAVPVALVLAVATVDAIAFGLGHPGALALNLILVWLVPHQLGYFYADGRLVGLPKRA